MPTESSALSACVCVCASWQLDSRRTLGNLERNGVKVEGLLSEVMLYSYCNDEPFYPAQVRPVSCLSVCQSVCL